MTRIKEKRFLLAVWPRTQRKKKRFLLSVGMTPPRGGLKGKSLAAKPPNSSPHPLSPRLIPSVARNLSPHGAKVIPSIARKLLLQRATVLLSIARNLLPQRTQIFQRKARNLHPHRTQRILSIAGNLIKNNKRNDNLQHHRRIKQFHCLRQIHQVL